MVRRGRRRDSCAETAVVADQRQLDGGEQEAGVASREVVLPFLNNGYSICRCLVR